MPLLKEQSGSVSPRLIGVAWLLPFFLCLLPILLLTVYCYGIASQSVLDIVRAENVSLTGNLSMLLTQDLAKMTSLSEAFASIDGTRRALAESDAVAVTTRLKALATSSPSVGRAVMVDASGAVYSYPTGTVSASELTGVLQSASATKRLAVSGIFRSEHSGDPVFALAVPVLESGSVIGAAAIEYRAGRIGDWLKNIDVPRDGSLFLLDHAGRVVAGSREGTVAGALEYASLPPVLAALGGTLSTEEYTDPMGNVPMVATFLPVAVGKNTWVIVAEKSVMSAYRDFNRIRINIALAGAVLTLMTLAMIVMIARIQRKNVALNRELGFKNQELRDVATIVDTSNDAIVSFTRDGRIRNWNAAAGKMYGWSELEIVGKPLSTLIPAEAANEFAGILTQVIRGETVQNFRTVRKKKDGGTVPVSVTVSPIKDETGTTIAVSSIDRDITEQKKLEQMKDDFISFVSHQLKAPVTAMRWTLEMLLGGDYGEFGPDARKAIEELSQTNLQNHALINDILNASRLERGVIAADIQVVDLRDVADRALRDYRKILAGAGLTVTMVNCEQPTMVKADKEKMAEAVANSIGNSIKHTKAGGLTFTIEKKDGFGVLHVTDTGGGMPPEILQKLFNRTGILGTDASADRSSGLGLYIAKNFMELQGGSISVSSELGKGSTFTYKVPLA